MIHDEDARSAALEQLLPLIRFPQLSAPSQLGVYADPLLLKLMAQPGGAAIAGQLLKECSAAFAETAEFQQCARGKRREGYAHPEPSRSPPRFASAHESVESACISYDWNFDGDSVDYIDVNATHTIWLHGVTVSEYDPESVESDQGPTAVLSVHETKEMINEFYWEVAGEKLNGDSDPIQFKKAVDGWCDLLFSEPVQLRAGVRYRIAAKCSEGGALRHGTDGKKVVGLGSSGADLHFYAGPDGNGTDVDRGQLNHLIYSM